MLEGLFKLRSVDIAHRLTHDLDALTLEVVEHTLRRDKRRAVSVDDFDTDPGAHLVTGLGSRPKDTRCQSGCQHEQDDILYQSFQRVCFLNSSHICGSRLAISPAPAVNKTSKLLKCIELIKFSFE